MNAIIYQHFGSIDVLQKEAVAEPGVSVGEVLVTVRAASLNVIDSRSRRGEMSPFVNKRFPKTPGVDFAGTILRVGANVSEFKAGDAVFGYLDPFKGGALAEVVAVKRDSIVSKPDALSFEEASAVPVTGFAALCALRDLGKVKTGDKILIYGSSGGAGLAAIQIAKHLGAHVTAVCGTSGVAICRELGSDVVLDYKKGPISFGQQFDLIIDFSSRFPFSQARTHLTPKGRYVDPSPNIPKVIFSALGNLLRGQKNLMLMATAKPADLRWLASLVEQRKLRVIIAKTFAMDEVREAFTLQESGGVLGKVVVLINPA